MGLEPITSKPQLDNLPVNLGSPVRVMGLEPITDTPKATTLPITPYPFTFYEFFYRAYHYGYAVVKEHTLKLEF